MTQSPAEPTCEDAPDLNTISRNAARRRIAIACGATAGVTFILAGLLAAPAVLPGVLDELRERELLPVHIIGGGGTNSPGAAGSAGSSGQGGTAGDAGSGSPGSSPAAGLPGAPGSPGSPGAPASEYTTPPPSVILPGGINLRDVLTDPTTTLDGAKNFVKDLVGDLPIDPPDTPNLPIDPPDAPELPIDLPDTPNLPIDVPETPPVPSLPVDVPDVSVPVPAVTVPTTPSAPAVTTPTEPTVPSTSLSVPTLPAPLPAPTIPDPSLSGLPL